MKAKQEFAFRIKLVFIHLVSAWILEQSCSGKANIPPCGGRHPLNNLCLL